MRWVRRPSSRARANRGPGVDASSVSDHTAMKETKYAANKSEAHGHGRLFARKPGKVPRATT